MNDLLRDVSSNSKFYDIQSALGHIILVADMCFFVTAVIDAHVRYEFIFKSTCSFDIDTGSIEIVATLGYVVRLIFTAILLIAKVINLYKFISRTNCFPKIGAIYAPFMSSLLLTIIVYDYENCTKISDIFSLQSAFELISSYSVIIIIVLSCLLVIQVTSIIKKRNRRSKFFTVLTLLLTLCIVLGSFVGLISEIEVLKHGKANAFVLFDLYSFCVALVFIIMNAGKRLENYFRRVQPN